VQDTLLGSSKFTRRDTFLTRDMVYTLLMHIENWDGTIPTPAILKVPGLDGKPVHLWTGKQIFSLIIPQVNLERFSFEHPDEEKYFASYGDTRVLIEQGELICGIVCKKTLGNQQGSLIHVIWNEKGPEATRDFIRDCQKVVNYWLLHNGFSVGIGDTVAPSSTLSEIEKIITNAKENVQKLIEDARTGKLERQPGSTNIESFEKQVNGVTNKATDAAGKLVQKMLDYRNNINAMVTAGSKGTLINICQIIACVGQQNVSGKRIPYGFKKRTLPHFNKEDLGPEARGFVENSYLQGLTASEFFFHAMGGREGLIDTAVKTAETGYIQRRLIKSMEVRLFCFPCSLTFFIHFLLSLFPRSFSLLCLFFLSLSFVFSHSLGLYGPI
jgi:DNA-directed RNA polymerase II subunit RPB1